MATFYFESFLVILLLLFSLFVSESHALRSDGIVYSREQLIALCRPVLLPGARHDIPEELRRLKRGCRAGAKLRMKKKRRYKPCVPAIIMGNVRSLGNKMDELGVLTKMQWEYRECRIMCFTETWLHTLIPDNNTALPGFTSVRADRDVILSGKKKGGGIAL